MLPKKIINDYCLEPYKHGWLKGIIDLDDRVFFHFFKEDKNEKFVFFTTMLNFNNEEIIDKYLKILEEQITAQNLDFSKLNKLPLFNINKFDNVIFAPFEYTLIPNSDFPEYDKRLIYIYPIYCFELNGDETKKDMKAITRNVLSTTEWNREACPLVRYKFKNPKHQYGTRGKDLVIDKEANVYSALKNFETNDCIMEVENSLHDALKITFAKETKLFAIEGEESAHLKFDDTKKYLEAFFRKCS